MVKAFFALTIILALNLSAERVAAADKDIIDAVIAADKALNDAFVILDRKALKELTAPDHVAVTPSYGRPMNTQEQLDTLADIKLKITSSSEPKVTVLAPNAVLLEQEKSYSGTFEGKPIPSRVYSTAVWSKIDGQWRERLYQETVIRQP